MSATALKAFDVSDGEHGKVVFAKIHVHARRDGANLLDCDFRDIEHCRRAPAFDEYANKGSVPVKALLEAGWWQSCSNCQHMVMEDMCDEEDDEGNPYDGPIFVDALPDDVWCSTECRDSDLAARARRHAGKRALREYAHRKWPGIVIDDVWDNGEHFRMYFTFPGQPKGHRCAFGTDGQLSMSEQSIVVFREYKASLADRDPGDEHVYRGNRS
jgi:hypothetical protein